MAKIEPIGPYLEPVRKSVIVPQSVDEAFRLFTGEIARWWPRDRYSVSQTRTRDVVFEAELGGRIYEVRDDDEIFDWGKVLIWEPPGRFVMSWHAGRAPDVAQEVEVRFTAADRGTRVELEHRNWTRLGSEAEVVRDRYAGGWKEVLGKCFVDACEANMPSDRRRTTG